MTPLRQRMIEDMRLRNFSPETERSNIHYKCMMRYGGIALRPMERPALAVRPYPGGNPE